MSEPLFNIGNVPLFNLCRLAPMASVTNLPFRLICHEFGSAMTTTEQISATGLVFASSKTASLADYAPQEKPIAMQLFGSHPDYLVKSALMLIDMGADIIDLNMGCPVKKVVKTGAGSALMQDEKLARTIFKQMRKALSVPFTIKMRTGWDETSLNAPSLAYIAQEEGIDAITIHGRTRSQFYSGQADWTMIKKVVDTVTIPVTGNGDVNSYADALRMKELTGCKGVMIGRGALGRPWIFDKDFTSKPLAEQNNLKLEAIKRHIRLIQDTYPASSFSLVQVQKHLSWYSKGLVNSSEFRQLLFNTKSIEKLLEEFHMLWEASTTHYASMNNLDIAHEADEWCQ